MDSLETDRQIIEAVLTAHTRIPYAHGDIQTEVVFDRAHDRYLLVNVGWQNNRRIHGSLVHIDVIDGKLWIQRDGTEHGVAKELVEAGVPKDRIVLAFHPADRRRHTDMLSYNYLIPRPASVNEFDYNAWKVHRFQYPKVASQGDRHGDSNGDRDAQAHVYRRPMV